MLRERQLIHHDRPDRRAFMHEVEGVVDFFQRHGVRDQIVDVDLSLHVPIDDFRHVGAASGAAERGAFPRAARDKLERPGGNFLARAGNADDDRHAPALVATFQRLPHDLHIADAFEGVIGAAIGQSDKMGDQIA